MVCLSMGVQGRTTTKNGARISAAMDHAPLFHESGRRGEAELGRSEQSDLKRFSDQKLVQALRVVLKSESG